MTGAWAGHLTGNESPRPLDQICYTRVGGWAVRTLCPHLSVFPGWLPCVQERYLNTQSPVDGIAALFPAPPAGKKSDSGRTTEDAAEAAMGSLLSLEIWYSMLLGWLISTRYLRPLVEVLRPPPTDYSIPSCHLPLRRGNASFVPLYKCISMYTYYLASLAADVKQEEWDLKILVDYDVHRYQMRKR